MSATPPRDGYYPKFGGFLAAIISRKGVAMDVDGFPAVASEFRTTSRETWLVSELRNVDDTMCIDPVAIAAKGELFGY